MFSLFLRPKLLSISFCVYPVPYSPFHFRCDLSKISPCAAPVLLPMRPDLNSGVEDPLDLHCAADVPLSCLGPELLKVSLEARFTELDLAANEIEKMRVDSVLSSQRMRLRACAVPGVGGV